MKRQFILFLSVLMGLTIQAQQATFVPDADSVHLDGLSSDVEIVAKNNLDNPGRGSVFIKWKRLTEDIGNWEGTLICDTEQCYSKAVSEAPVQAEITDSVKGNLDVHFKPDGNAGEGKVELLVWDVNDSLNSHYILTYTAKADLASSVEDPSSIGEKIKVYPNPARDYLYLKDLPENIDVNVEVYNILGRKMESAIFSASSSKNEQRINISELQKGIYLVRIFDAQMNILATHSISKMK